MGCIDREFIMFKLEKIMRTNPDVVAFFWLEHMEDTNEVVLDVIPRTTASRKRLNEVRREINVYLNTAADNDVFANSRLGFKTAECDRLW